MAKLLLLFVLCTIFVVGFSKHIHPRNIRTEEDSIDTQAAATNVDEMPIKIISQIKPSRFVPINNLFSFIKYPPCDEGFERDLLGVCREVWD